MQIGLDKSGFQELFAMLYLRLNGYFTSGFIVHAPKDNTTQIDVLAVRFPFNAEPEREVDPSPWLQIPPLHNDILICEVKGGNEHLQFNGPFRNKNEAIHSVLRWIGIINDKALDQVVDKFQNVIQTEEVQTPNTFKGISNQDLPGIIAPGISIRGVLFAPDRQIPTHNQPRFVYGQEMIDYTWKCFCPAQTRTECATRYDFKLWGIYKQLVCYFKDRQKAGHDAGTMEDIYKHFKL